MLVFNVTFRCRPGMRDAFLNAIRAEGIAEAARAEAGNLQYDWYLPADGGDDLFLVEKYTDADSYTYFLRIKGKHRMHENTEALLEKLLVMLRDEGEEKTFAYIRGLLKEKKHG